jgi:hypothetical protein
MRRMLIVGAKEELRSLIKKKRRTQISCHYVGRKISAHRVYDRVYDT